MIQFFNMLWRRYVVDKQLEEKLNKKISEVAEKSNELFKIVKSLD